MSELKVNVVSSYKKTAAIEFPTGISGDGSRLSNAPKILEFNPQPFSAGISTNTNIVLTFDQAIGFNSTGTINIRGGSATGSITETFICGVSTRATISGIGSTVLTIDPTQSLGVATSYYLELPVNGIANTFGQFFTGVETNRYYFTTAYAQFLVTGGNYTFSSPSLLSPTGVYKYHVFTGTGPLVLNAPSSSATDLSMLLIAGGGGGGSTAPGGGGGGGAGGVISRTGPSLALPSGSYTVTIGAGSPTNGNPSKITPVPAASTILEVFAGGQGASNPSSPGVGNPGGSGGGGAASFPISTALRPAGFGAAGQGNPGAVASFSSPTVYFGGGGGGAGGAGSGMNGGNGTPNPAFPGPLLSANIPAPVFPTDSASAIGPTGLYGGGGGAMGNPGTPFGSAGPGGGGIAPYTSAPARPGKALTGGGGGGGGTSGGSGVFMIRYASPS